MRISDDGIRRLKAEEGLRLKSYPDAGAWSIGYGSTRGPDGQAVKPGDTITEGQAEDLLRRDVGAAEAAIAATIGVPLAQEHIDSLVSLIYNIGIGGFQSSTLARKLAAGDYDGAEREFARWNKSREGGELVVNDVLVARRAREAALFSIGTRKLREAAPDTAPPAADLEPMAEPIMPPAGGYDDFGRPISTAIEAPPARPREAPAITPSTHRAEASVSPIIAAILPELTRAIPELAKLFGSGSAVAQRNAAAAAKVVEIVQQATGAVNAQQATERVSSDPQAASAARQAVQERWWELSESGGGGVAGARAMNERIAASDTPMWRQPAAIVSLVLLPLVYWVVGAVLHGWGGEWSGEIRASVVAAVISGVLGSITGYWLGTSWSSYRKDAAGR